MSGGNWFGRPTDEQMRAFLEGEHGPPSAEVLQIVQDELEHNVRSSRHFLPHAEFGDDPSGHCGCSDCNALDPYDADGGIDE